MSNLELHLFSSREEVESFMSSKYGLKSLTGLLLCEEVVELGEQSDSSYFRLFDFVDKSQTSGWVRQVNGDWESAGGDDI